jgi:plasmid stabilization system protein ParE
MAATIETLVGGPQTPGLQQRPDLPPGFLTLRAPPVRKRGQHVLVVRCHDGVGQPSVEVLRVLHVQMDLPRHLRPRS